MADSISLESYIDLGIRARKSIELGQVRELAGRIIRAARNGGKLITFGNGGSAADAQHFVGELDGHFTRERSAIPAVCLSTNTSSLTAIGNDYSYDDVFFRPISALCSNNDVVVGISTSGNSRNVLKAIEEANRKGAFTVGLTGKSGGKLAGIASMAVKVDSDFTPIIQEAHITFIHMVCLAMDQML
ncbi:MAG: SIS domain-containing protein [Thermoplasmataceae archaeon]